MDMFFGSYAGDLAIDLGTANTLVSVRGKGKGTVTDTGGRSRKDRIFVTAERRV